MFTEEVIDRRVVNAVRTENSVLGTVDYVETRGKKSTAIPFQTCALERDHVVYQLGTGDAANALRAAQVGLLIASICRFVFGRGSCFQCGTLLQMCGAFVAEYGVAA